ncbi:MAG: S-adenosylmethionine:tRNA ribosyltransferase-isomerase [Candidatus Peribacteria bacterium]|nr:MAG: S-adenosylmethionine:tRNA ribosyltransferase-isomerase [Candidatus Peribacteria bacterium]
MSAETKLFIYPSYEFRIIDSLITNFHLPQSSLLMLVAGFIGYDEMQTIYKHAIDQAYMFYSFGDAMLLQRD